MSSSRPILRLGTRSSLLARAQAQLILDLLAPHFAGQIILEFITTTGDKLQPPVEKAAETPPHVMPPLGKAGVKGLFVKEIEDALLAGRIDLAVHSAKDLPTQLPPGLLIAATPPRELPNDVLIAHTALTIEQLPAGATVGTSSLRRQAQLLMRRPDLHVIPFRGNIDSRLRKISSPSTEASASGLVCATLLAAAGLRRANLMPPHAIPLATDKFIPAAGQGTLALECRTDDTLVRDLLQKIHDLLTFATLEFERHIIQAFAADCLSPIAVCAEPRGIIDNIPQQGWIVRALIATPDGAQSARATLLTADPSPVGLHALAPLLIQTLESRGARQILASLAT